MSDKYRKCVGIVVYNNDKKVLLCERSDMRGQWQFPQGGIEKGESIIDAAYRELWEETSIVSVEKPKIFEKTFRYDFPFEVAKKFVYVGQEICWVFLEFVGKEDEINLVTDGQEFVAWKWADVNEALEKIVAFKHGVYEQAVEYFKRMVK
ncbi:MAG: RNA pyrophosphohydrolase [Alphaproteobacteria bacterium]|nr:RNA pyrophosphohydrolase [Alphaproteobacteria bacterium]